MIQSVLQQCKCTSYVYTSNRHKSNRLKLHRALLAATVVMI